MKITFGSPECGGGAQRENVWNQNDPTNTLSSPFKAEVSKTEFQASSGMSFWCLTIRPHNPSTLFMLLDLKTNVSGNHLPHGSSVTGPVYLTSCIREIINLGINKILSMNLLFCSVQSLSHVWLFATPWTAALQASLSITSSRSLLKHVHRVGGAIQPSHPLSSPSPPAFNLSQHQGLLQWDSSLHQVAKVLELQHEHHSFQCTFRVDFL